MSTVIYQPASCTIDFDDDSRDRPRALAVSPKVATSGAGWCVGGRLFGQVDTRFQAPTCDFCPKIPDSRSGGFCWAWTGWGGVWQRDKSGVCPGISGNSALCAPEARRMTHHLAAAAP
jgi:hypothetical protein